MNTVLREMTSLFDAILSPRRAMSATRQRELRNMSFDHDEARAFLFSSRQASLGTLAANHPYVSAVNVVAANDGAVLFLVSRLAEHSTNLQSNDQCSLLLTAAGADDVQQAARLTLQARAEPVPTEQAGRYLALYPGAVELLKLDFYFLQARILRARWIPGVGRARWLDGEAIGAPLPWNAVQEQAMVQHMNDDHAGVLRHCLHLLGGEAAEVSLAALDPWGLWLLADGVPRRLSFDEPALTPGRVHAILTELAHRPVPDSA